MRLKKLILFGFKSFALKTTFEFSPGMTAIVGPNGCGKSNIVDAFRWVMGQTTAKGLRSEKMTDVIFNGTNQRRSAPFAEVTLIFDQVEGEGFEEVEVTRRLDPDGESHYFLNKRSVRLKDIHHLFAGTGIGKGGFWIFEQGKIDQVIHWSPQDRREIFEEAAGVTGFLMKKRDAEGRLKEAEENARKALERHTELLRIVETLKRQAEEAKIYRERADRLKKIECSHIFFSHQKNGSNLKEIQEKLEEINAAEKGGHDVFEQKQKEIFAAKEELAKRELDREKAREDELLTEHQMRSVQDEAVRVKNQESLLAAKRAHLQETIDGLKLVKDEKSISESDCLVQVQTIDQFKADLERLKSEILGGENELASLKKEVRSLEEKRLASLQKGHALSSELRELNVRSSNAKEQINRGSAALKALEDDISKKKEILETKKQEKAQVYKIIQQIESDLEEIKLKESQLLKALETALKGLKESQRELTRLEMQERALIGLRKEGSGVKELLSLAKDQNSPFYQTVKPLYEALDVSVDVLEALSSTLRPFTDALVVENQEILEKLVRYTLEKNITDFALIASENLNPLIENLKIVDGVESAFENVKNDKGLNIWSKENLWITPHLFVSRYSPKEENPLFREKEIKRLKSSICAVQVDVDRWSQEEKSIQEEVSRFAQERNHHTRELQQRKMAQVTIDLHLEREERDLQRALLQVEKIESERRELEAFLLNLANRQEALAMALSQVQKEEKESEDLAVAQLLKCTEKEESFNHKKGLYLEDTRKLSEMTLHLEKMRQEIAFQEIKARQREQRLEEAFSELNLLNDEEKQRGENQALLKRKLEGLEKEQKRVKEHLALCLSGSLKVRESIGQLENELEALRVSQLKVNDEKMALHMKSVDLVQKQKGLEQELLEKYQLTLDQIQPDDLITGHFNEISQLRRLIQDVSKINFAAIDDLERESKGVEELTAEIEDLNKAVIEVRETIEELDQKSRSSFKATFEEVAAHFKENFKTLFEGGEARLTLVDTDDLLTAGIEIEAEPPGKKLRSIQLLSGGERCLTSIALLLALFRVKPAPICLLDEIDAPLDETNVKRFLNVIKPFSEKTQLVVITHNRQTMSRADILLGVSMEERGVSKLLSLSFAQEKVLEPISVTCSTN